MCFHVFYFTIYCKQHYQEGLPLNFIVPVAKKIKILRSILFCTIYKSVKLDDPDDFVYAFNRAHAFKVALNA